MGRKGIETMIEYEYMHCDGEKHLPDRRFSIHFRERSEDVYRCLYCHSSKLVETPFEQKRDKIRQFLAGMSFVELMDIARDLAIKVNYEVGRIEGLAERKVFVDLMKDQFPKIEA